MLSELASRSNDGTAESTTQSGSETQPSGASATPVALAAFGSVLYSWYNFYVQDNKAYGLFVGLWAPTLLAFANYLQNE
jgi:hypothetical protein